MILTNVPRWLAALAIPLALCVLSGCAKKAPEPEEPKRPSLQVGYAVEDPDAMSKALDEAYEKMQERMTLSYKNDAFSSDGKTFTCYIANSPDNAPYDMFVGLYSDLEFTDCLFLSQLLRPGSAFETLTLERALEPGTHQLYAVFTS